MWAIFIAIFVVMAIMIYFVTLSLRIVTENASKKVNSYFLSKLEEFDNDFEDKLNVMAQLQVEKDEIQQEIRILKMDHRNMEVSRFYKPRPVIRDTYIPIARYIDNGFFEDYKLAKNLLVMDKEQIIRDIMEKFPYKGNIERYNSAKKIQDMLNFEAVYDLSTFEKEKQLITLDQIFSDGEAKLFEEFVSELSEVNDFELLTFINWIKQVLDIESPILHAYLGDPDEDYSYISPNVVCHMDDNVCEGIRIIYQSQLFDYSIYESRRKNERVY